MNDQRFSHYAVVFDSSALYKAGLVLPQTGKIVIISSQAGSAAWRLTQNKDEGGNYGHHMSRAACNIMGVLLSEELKKEGIPIQVPAIAPTGPFLSLSSYASSCTIPVLGSIHDL